MVTTELLTEKVWSAIQAAAHGARGRKYAAVAFVGADGAELLSDFGVGDILVCNMGREALRAGTTNPFAIERLIVRGVDVYSHERLHAKVYVFGDLAVVGSANASASAANRLAEAAIRSRDRSLATDARRFIRGMCRDAIAVDETYLEFARSEYRQPRGGNGGRGRKPGGDKPDFRLYVTGYVGATPPRLVEAHYQANHRDRQAEAGPPAKWSVDISWDNDEKWIRRDDWVLWVDADADSIDVHPPMKVLGRKPAGGRSAQIVTWYRVPLRKKSLPWDHVFGRVLAAADYRLKRGGPIRSTAGVNAVFAEWGLDPYE